MSLEDERPAALTIQVEEEVLAGVGESRKESEGIGTSSSVESSLFSPTMSEASFTPNGSKSSRGKWTPEEDEVLKVSVLTHGGRNWKKISEFLDGRTDVQCLHRWQKVLRPGLVKGPWTKEEDEKVVELVGAYGVKSWSFIARKLEGRLGKQCRERWYNHLNPDINKDPWSAEEDKLIIDEHEIHGNKWAEIAKSLPGRTDNAIKNRWNSTLQRLLRASPSSKKVKSPRVKRVSKKKEKAATNVKVQRNHAEDDDADSICLSLDTEHVQLETDVESEGRTTVSSCSGSLSPSSQDIDHRHLEDHKMLPLSNVMHAKSSYESSQRERRMKKKMSQTSTKKASVRSFSPEICEIPHQESRPEIMSPLDALIIAANSSFTATKYSPAFSTSTTNRMPYSPSILRRRNKSPCKAKSQKNSNKRGGLSNTMPMNDAGVVHTSNSTLDKLHQLATLSAAPLSGSISLRGEEFCMSPIDVRRSEQMHQSSVRIDSPTKRRKFSAAKLNNLHSENISDFKEQDFKNSEHESDEDIIAESLLRMKTAHTLVNEF